jgi:hypothetical protein
MRVTISAAVWVGLSLITALRGARAGTIVLESHVEARASGAEEILAPFFDELTKRQVKGAYEDVGKRFEARSSTPSVVGAGLPSDFAEQVETGYRLWVRGQFQAAISALQPLVDVAHLNAGVVAADLRSSAAVFKALVALSLCHQRMGDETASRAAMAELLRSFDSEVSKGQFGVEAHELFVRLRSELRSRGTASLSVRSLDDSAVIFLNERFLKVGEATRTDLVPGSYRVLGQVGRRRGRVHLVDLKAGDNVRLEIDPEFESSVVTSTEWSGLVFRDRQQREQRETELAARFALSVEALGVIVVGIDVKNDRSVAYGALINPSTRKELRRGSVVIDTSPSPERLRALARFLTGDSAGEGVDVDNRQKHPLVSPPIAVPREAGQRRPSHWKWAATGGAVVGLGTGVALLLFDGSCIQEVPQGMRCPDIRDLRTAGYISLGAGAALGAMAVWLWRGEDRAVRSTTTLWISPTMDGGIAGLSLPIF